MVGGGRLWKMARSIWFPRRRMRYCTHRGDSGSRFDLGRISGDLFRLGKAMVLSLATMRQPSRWAAAVLSAVKDVALDLISISGDEDVLPIRTWWGLVRQWRKMFRFQLGRWRHHSPRAVSPSDIGRWTSVPYFSGMLGPLWFRGCREVWNVIQSQKHATPTTRDSCVLRSLAGRVRGRKPISYRGLKMMPLCTSSVCTPP
ncbi:hypothetical protein VUR80DRAFT_293 [Thermomyces stellatus]